MERGVTATNPWRAVLAACVIGVTSTTAWAGNVIPNGSFEIGMGTWIGWDSGMRGGVRDPLRYDEITLVKKDLITDAEAKLGRRCFHFNFPGFIRSKDIKLDPLKRYTISFYAKGTGGYTRITSNLDSSYRPGQGHGKRLLSEGVSVTPGKVWQRYHMTVALPESRNGYYKLRIGHPDETSVWVDGVQLEEGEALTDYGPARKVDIGLATGREKESNLFYTTEKVLVRATISASGRQGGTLAINYALYDYRGGKLQAFERTVTLDAEGYGEETVVVDPAWQGLMSLIAEAKVEDDVSRDELVFGHVRPPLPPSHLDGPLSPVGSHVSGNFSVNVAEKLGIRWQRLHDFFDKDGSVRWIDVEPEEGTFVFQDAGIDRYRSHGFNLIGTLFTAPEWALRHPTDVKQGWANHLPDVEKWRRYVFETVAHFKGRINYWEVWNEPFSHSWWSDTPENYFVLLKTAWEAAKEADPGCRIVGGCLAPLDYASTRSFMNRLFASGGLEYMDVLSIHANQGGATASGPAMSEENMGGVTGSTVTQSYGDITALMKAYGEVKPIWNTEHPIWCMPYSRMYPWVDDVGWTRQDPPQNPVQGAQFVVRSVVAEMANNCPKTFFYPFQGGHGRHEDGDLTSSLLSGHMKLKSTSVVMAELLRQLGRAEFIRAVDWGTVARCYLFKTPEGPVAIAWGLRAHAKAGMLQLPAAAGAFTYLDIMGNPRRDIEKNEHCTLPLGAEPVYIRADAMKDLSATLAAARMTGLMPEEAGGALRQEEGLAEGLIYAGEAEVARNLRVYVFDRDAGSVALIVSDRKDAPVMALSPSENLTIREVGEELGIADTKDHLKVFEIAATPVVIEVPDVKADTLLQTLRSAELRCLREFELEGIWVTTVEGKPMLSVKLTNVSLRELSPTINITSLPAGAELETLEAPMQTLPPGRTGQVDIPFSHARVPEQCSGNVEISVTGGTPPVAFTRPLALAYALRAENAISVDGDLSEWSRHGSFALDRKDQVVIGQMVWRGRSDLSAAVRSRWDDNFVYFAVEVTDDYPDRKREVMQVWNGTSVEIFVDTNQREDLGKNFYDKDDFQILFGPATKRFDEDVWGIAPHSGQSHLAGLAMASKETPGGYTMEIALPRGIFAMELLPGVLKARYGAGLSVGLSIALNDRAKEKEGRKSSLVWGGTIRNYLDPSRFGTLVLLP